MLRLWEDMNFWRTFWRIPHQTLCGSHTFKKKFFLMFVFNRERAEHERGRGREREGDTESEAGSRL